MLQLVDNLVKVKFDTKVIMRNNEEYLQLKKVHADFYSERYGIFKFNKNNHFIIFFLFLAFTTVFQISSTILYLLIRLIV